MSAGDLVSGVVAPYHETSHLVPFREGERLMPHAFCKSLAGRETRIPLVLGHARHVEGAIGMSREWHDEVVGLRAKFAIKPGPEGDRTLQDCAGGWLSGLSVEFAATDRGIGADGVSEVRSAHLIAVALVTTPAYDRARVTPSTSTPELVAARRAAPIRRYLPPPRPVVDLSPINIPYR